MWKGSSRLPTAGPGELGRSGANASGGKQDWPQPGSEHSSEQVFLRAGRTRSGSVLPSRSLAAGPSCARLPISSSGTGMSGWIGNS